MTNTDLITTIKSLKGIYNEIKLLIDERDNFMETAEIYESLIDHTCGKMLNERIQELSHNAAYAELVIDSLPDDRYKEILCRRYAQGETVEIVAKAMMYSTKHILDLHKKALQAAEELHNCIVQNGIN